MTFHELVSIMASMAQWEGILSQGRPSHYNGGPFKLIKESAIDDLRGDMLRWIVKLGELLPREDVSPITREASND